VLERVRAYHRVNPKENIVAATQAALWLVQGVSLDEIRTKFSISAAEAQLARQFIR
jgi:hypothetical protein